jgi:ribonuclease-3
LKLFSFLFKSSKSQQEPFRLKIKELINYFPKDMAVFKEAVTHKSAKASCNYERLEFLGDSILDATVSKHIFDTYRKLNEGELTQLRSKLVRRKNLNRLGKELQFEKVIVSSFSAEDIPENMYGNVLEALVGAIYLDGGQEAATKFIDQFVLSELSTHDFEKVHNFKGKLLEWGSKNEKKIEFVTTPDNYAFVAQLKIDDDFICEGHGKNKKSAEQEAAKEAVEKLSISLS